MSSSLLYEFLKTIKTTIRTYLPLSVALFFIAYLAESICFSFSTQLCTQHTPKFLNVSNYN